MTDDLATTLTRLDQTATPGPWEVVRLDQEYGAIAYQLQALRGSDPRPNSEGSSPIVASGDDAESPKARRDFELLALLRNNVGEIVKALREWDDIRCLFCGKRRTEVRQMIRAATGAAICNECTGLAAGLIAEREAARKTEEPPGGDTP